MGQSLSSTTETGSIHPNPNKRKKSLVNFCRNYILPRQPSTTKDSTSKIRTIPGRLGHVPLIVHPAEPHGRIGETSAAIAAANNALNTRSHKLIPSSIAMSKRHETTIKQPLLSSSSSTQSSSEPCPCKPAMTYQIYDYHFTDQKSTPTFGCRPSPPPSPHFGQERAVHFSTGPSLGGLRGTSTSTLTTPTTNHDHEIDQLKKTVTFLKNELEMTNHYYQKNLATMKHAYVKEKTRNKKSEKQTLLLWQDAIAHSRALLEKEQLMNRELQQQLQHHHNTNATIHQPSGSGNLLSTFPSNEKIIQQYDTFIKDTRQMLIEKLMTAYSSFSSSTQTEKTQEESITTLNERVQFRLEMVLGKLMTEIVDAISIESTQQQERLKLALRMIPCNTNGELETDNRFKRAIEELTELVRGCGYDLSKDVFRVNPQEQSTEFIELKGFIKNINFDESQIQQFFNEFARIGRTAMMASTKFKFVSTVDFKNNNNIRSKKYFHRHWAEDIPVSSTVADETTITYPALLMLSGNNEENIQICVQGETLSLDKKNINLKTITTA